LNNQIPDWINKLESEDLNFIKRFILTSGSLKAIASEYGVTYPTVRLKLNKLIERIELNDQEEPESYVSLIKQLAMNDQIDFDAAKVLIAEYRKQNKGE
jgi:hypothetical protein